MLKTTTKKCSGCKMFRSVLEFYKDKRAKDGLGCYCKECRRKQNREYMRKKRLEPAFRELENKQGRKYHQQRKQKAKEFFGVKVFCCVCV